MSSRKFNLICIVALIAVAALAMLVAGLGQGHNAPPVAVQDHSLSEVAPSGMTISPLSLSLSLTIVVDVGLMTLGLVILFMDEAPSRYRVR